MKTLAACFEANRAWSARMREKDPDYFRELAKEQRPELLWIGCSDSRVPANLIIDRSPGELFVHRNVGNVVVHSDLNLLSVLQFGIEMLGVRHVIVCGHYGCGGVEATLRQHRLGLSDAWLHHIEDVHERHRAEIAALPTLEAKRDRLCELHVIAQVKNACRTGPVRDAWAAGRELSVHGWIYDVKDGLLRDLGPCITGPAEAANLVSPW